MLYTPPVGGASNDPYVDANLGTGTEGSLVPAAAIENPQREIVNAITVAGLTPGAANNQLAAAISAIAGGALGGYVTKAAAQANAYCTCNAGGTANALTGAFTPAVTPLSDGMTLYVRAASANTTTTPTFKADTTAAKTIVKGNNLPLVAGDIAGAAHWLELEYDSHFDVWVLSNPATGVVGGIPASSFTGANQSLATSGYQKLPGGLILQWFTNTTAVPEAGYNVTLPMTFPNACFAAFVTPMNPTEAVLGGSHAELVSISTTTVRVFIQSDASGNTTLGFTGFAIGN